MSTSLKTILTGLALLAVAGCVYVPTGPSVMVLPGSGKSFEQFQGDDALCRQWAGYQIGQSPQQVAEQNVVGGSVAGTLIGAGLGAALGAAAGDPGLGAGIGAASGLLIGSSAGAESAQATGWDAQRRYDVAYQQCMYAKGNQIPVAGQRRSSGRSIAPSRGYYPVPPDYYEE
ncbi:MAG: glycine zipper family protein [Deltaproteobacteria bacterium]|nr:glycine zipper family protein [Deltaproteobacteria bacterium]TLN02727.1 MAG: glycine zipper family protein [bacterium]